MSHASHACHMHHMHVTCITCMSHASHACHMLHVHRGTLYRDMTQSLCEVKLSVAENMQKVKERLGLKDKETDPKGTSVRSSEDKVSPLLKPDAIKAIQDENADLIKSVSALRVWSPNRHAIM